MEREREREIERERGRGRGRDREGAREREKALSEMQKKPKGHMKRWGKEGWGRKVGQ